MQRLRNFLRPARLVGLEADMQRRSGSCAWQAAAAVAPAPDRTFIQIEANGCSKPKTTDTAKTVDIRSSRAAVWVNGGVVAGAL
ncbi:hypothetical protein GCM10022290_25950 [Sagittula marina]